MIASNEPGLDLKTEDVADLVCGISEEDWKTVWTRVLQASTSRSRDGKRKNSGWTSGSHFFSIVLGNRAAVDDMSWSEFLTLMLESTNKVEKAAIFNRKGQPLATTEDLQITESDGRALLNCLQDPARCLTRITLDGKDFRCFQGNSTALVGRATTDSRRVLVARLTEEALVVVIGNSTGHGSFLYEVQHHLEERARRQRAQLCSAGEDGDGVGEASQAKSQSSKSVPVLPPTPQSPLPASGIGQGDVLVQLHD